jgi:hypothetical protein
MDAQQIGVTPKRVREAKIAARLAYHDAMLNVEHAAGLLQVSTAWIRRLTHEGVLHKVDGRYRLIDTVQAYLRYQRDENRRSGKAAVTNRVIEARAREIEVRTRQREGRLMETEHCMEMVDTMVGLFLTGLSELPAQCGGRDLALRRDIEKATLDLRRKIAAKAREFAEQREAA